MPRHLVTITLISILTLASCSSGPATPEIIPPPTFKSLKHKDDVLNNLELAYKRRNFDQVDRLIADDFVFDNAQTLLWDKIDELIATANLFGPDDTEPPYTVSLQHVEHTTWGELKARYIDPVGGTSTVTTIDLALTYEVGDAAWRLDPDPQDIHPGEKWFLKTLTYDMTVNATPQTYVSVNLRARFGIRFTDIGGEKIWQIVSWIDDV